MVVDTQHDQTLQRLDEIEAFIMYAADTNSAFNELLAGFRAKHRLGVVQRLEDEGGIASE